MTDKVQKIRKEVERLQNELIQEKEKGFGSDADDACILELQNVLTYIDSLQEEPVSEPNEQLAETYLAVFDKKFPILPTLKGKQLEDYKNFLNKCQQIFGLKEWGIRPTQAKLFEKLSLLWAVWGVEHLQGVGRQDKKEQDIPVSEDLEEAAENFANEIEEKVATPQNPCFYEATLHHLRFGFVQGAKWQKEQDKETIELAEDHAMLAGMEKMKEEMMKDAVDAFVYRGGIRLKEWPLSGARVEKTYPIKLIIIKQEEK